MATIRPFLDVSTAHLAPADVAYLDAPARAWTLGARSGCYAASMPHGWFVYVHDDQPEDCSDELWAILQHAKKHGCAYVLFDADAPEDDELPILDPEVLQEREQSA